MEITKDNFKELEEKIISNIYNCDFISFDLELTGIANHLKSYLDSPNDRYSKLKFSAEKFKIIQIGIVTWNKENKDISSSYIANSYNIYVFPNEDSLNTQINCEVSAIIFNRENNMDFNKWIFKGVNYLNSKQFKHYKDNLADNNINNYDPEMGKIKKVYLTNADDKTKYQNFSNKFNDFIYSEQQSFIYDKLPKFFLYYLLNNLSPEVRKSIYICNSVDDKNNPITIFKKVEEKEREMLINKENEEKAETLKKAKGFTNIYDAIIQSKKPLIGHNCLLDLLFCFTHFGDELPNSYYDFKKLLKQTFIGGIFDTKYLFYINEDELINEKIEEYETSLELVYSKLFEKIGNKVNIKILNEDSNYKNKNNKLHHADYDAFITGACYIYMNELIIDKSKIKKNNFKLNFMKTFYDCFDFNGDEIYKYPNTTIYCLRFNGKFIDFDFNDKIKQEFKDEIEFLYLINQFNVGLIFVKNDIHCKQKVENLLKNKFNKIFTVFNIDQFRKLIEEENMKKKGKK